MSIVSFNGKFEASVKMSGSSYDTRGFTFRGKFYSGYTGSFDVEYKVKGTTAPIRQQTCYQYPDFIYDFAVPKFASGVTESGFINAGFPYLVEKTFLAKTLPFNYGQWVPNKKPEIKYEVDADGVSKVEIDGDNITAQRVYIVQNAEKFEPNVIRKDQPIYLQPGIVTLDTNAVVYEGDIIHIYPTQGEDVDIKIIRQKRYPKPDRTFFWTPNTSPVLTKGGYSNGVLVAPGTVMIPNKTTSLRDYDGGDGPPPSIPPDEVLPIDYVYAGQGIVFDGDDWVSLVGVPARIKKKDDTYAHRNIFLHDRYIDEDQQHISLTERFFSNRPLIFLNGPVDNSPSGQAQLTAERPDPPEPGPAPEDLTLDLYSDDRAFFDLLYDFGDAWSRYHQANKDWRDNIYIEYGDVYLFGWVSESRDEPDPPPDPDPGTGDSDPDPGTGDSDPDPPPDPDPPEPLEQFIVYAPAQTFRDGEVTTVEYKDNEGKVVAGSTLSQIILVQFQG
jgi:hypothetical protein